MKQAPLTGPLVFTQKVDGWLDRLDKKLDADTAINRALLLDAAVHEH